MGKQMLRAAILVGLSLVFVQCGSKKEGIDSLVTVSTVGGSPLLRHTSQTLGDRTLAAPWFQTKIIVQNSSGKLIKIDFVRVVVDVNGQEKEAQVNHASEFDYTSVSGIAYNFKFCSLIPDKNNAFYIAACGNNRTSPNPNVDPDDNLLRSPFEFYVQSFASMQEIGNNFIFSIRIILEGAVYDSTGQIPEDRFTKVVNLSTR